MFGPCLDLYVQSKFRFELGAWLITEGYRYAPSLEQDPDFTTAASASALLQYSRQSSDFPYVAAKFKFAKHPASKVPVEVEVVVAARAPMDTILNTLPSACTLT